MPQPAALWPSLRNVFRQRLTIFSGECYQQTILLLLPDTNIVWRRTRLDRGPTHTLYVYIHVTGSVEIAGLDNGGPDNAGLEIAGLDIRRWFAFCLVRHRLWDSHTCFSTDLSYYLVHFSCSVCTITENRLNVDLSVIFLQFQSAHLAVTYLARPLLYVYPIGDKLKNSNK